MISAGMSNMVQLNQGVNSLRTPLVLARDVFSELLRGDLFELAVFLGDLARLDWVLFSARLAASRVGRRDCKAFLAYARRELRFPSLFVQAFKSPFSLLSRVSVSESIACM